MPGKTRTAPGLLALAFLLAAAGWSAAGQSKREQAQRWLDAAVDAHAKLDFGKAVQAAGEAIRLDRTWGDAYFVRARCLYFQGECDRAIADFDRVVELGGVDPSWVVYAAREAAYRDKGELGKAIADGRKAIELGPNKHGPHGELALTYQRAGRLAEAIEEASAALKHEPNDYRSLVVRGGARCLNGDFGGGAEDLARAIRVEPENPWAYRDRALAWMAVGKDDAAIEDCDRVIKSRPRDQLDTTLRADAFRIRALLREKNGEKDAAINDLTEALRLNPKHARALIERGRIHGEKGDYKKAVADFSEHIRYYPNAPAGYEMRGLAYLALGDTEAAAADQRKLQELSKKAAAEKDAK